MGSELTAVVEAALQEGADVTVVRIVARGNRGPGVAGRHSVDTTGETVAEVVVLDTRRASS